MDIKEQVPLAPLTTFGIGGPACYFALVQNIQEVCEAFAFAKAKSLPVFILGGGSNVLFDDAGFDGLVIKVDIRGIQEEGNTCVVGAGESWDALVAYTIEKELWGLENLSGIPGTVGGAVVQNIGAYGAALSQTLLWVEAYDTHKQKEVRLTKEECASGYRDSIFKRTPGRFVVLRVALQLSREGESNISYKDLQMRFGTHTPSLKEVREAVLEIRKNKFPDPAIEGSTGSFFKNPVLPETEARRLQAKYPELPLFSLPESTNIKVPLGWFLDYRNGVIDMREVVVGGARMYEKQFLVVATKKGASSHDVKKLAHIVQEKVRTVLHIEIEPEVCIV